MRWGHGHTFAGGLLAGLLLDHQAALLFAFAFGLGALVVAGWRKIMAAGAWAVTILEGFAGRAAR